MIPQSVARELAPPAVRSWIERPPSWLEVLAPSAPDLAISLGAGERDAICLALELDADIVLIDDGAARRVAEERGIAHAGTLGVLELASIRRLTNLAGAVEKLLRTNYRIKADVVQTLLERRPRDRRTSESDLD